jgi:penicillin-binding protein 1A
MEPPRPLVPARRRPSEDLTAATGQAARRRGWLWRYRRLLFLLWLFGFSALAGAVYLLSRVPLPSERRSSEATLLTDANGERLASLDSGVDRVAVPLDQVPQTLIDAVVSTEDRSFFSHRGVDPVGLARATVADLRNRGSVQGGSTITQQYVKNAYVGGERSVWRKLKEAAIALKLEHKYTKRQILERYLNTIYFGRGAYGVQAASRAYFGKDVGQLGLPEASYLAGLIRSPETADAKRSPATATVRRSLALRAMVATHHITAAQRAGVEAIPIASYVVDQVPTSDRVAEADKGTQYFVDAVRRQLIDRFGEAEVFGGGLRVRTSLDLRLQQQAYDAVYGFLKPGEPAGALVSIDDQGAVRAMVGGRDWEASKVNLALGRDGGGTGRQAGSTFKPFLLAEAVREGFSVQASLPGPPSLILPGADNGADYPVTNFENEDFGDSISLVDATANSVNTVYAQLETAIGASKLADMAHQLGVQSALQPDASLVLGTAEVSVLEMAAAYSTLANRGVRIDPVTILEVTTADGTVLQRAQPARTRVLTPEQADVVTYCLRQVVDHGTGTGAAIGRPVAGKTGTTENYGDAWFIGYTPKLTTAVWMGWPEGASRTMTSVRGRAVNGGSFPATIWQRFMRSATQGTPVDSFVEPSTLGGRPIKGVKVILPTTTTSSTTTTAPAPTTTTVPRAATTTNPPTTTQPTTTAPRSTTTVPATTTTTAGASPPTTLVH